MSEWQAEWDYLSVDPSDDLMSIPASTRVAEVAGDDVAGALVDEPLAEPLVWLDDFME